MVSPKHLLTKREYHDILQLSHSSLSIENEESLNEVLSSLHSLIPCDFSVCAHWHIPSVISEDKINLKLMNHSFPDEFLSIYFREGFYMVDSTIQKFVEAQAPVNFIEADMELGGETPATHLAMDFGLYDGWLNGRIDMQTLMCTSLCIGGEKTDTSERTRAIVKYVTPFISMAYGSLLERPKPEITNIRLTMREYEVLNWLKHGKSSWEISTLLNLQERTVIFHITNIKTKLNCVTRTQAVAAALRLGLIGF